MSLRMSLHSSHLQPLLLGHIYMSKRTTLIHLQQFVFLISSIPSTSAFSNSSYVQSAVSSTNPYSHTRLHTSPPIPSTSTTQSNSRTSHQPPYLQPSASHTSAHIVLFPPYSFNPPNIFGTIYVFDPFEFFVRPTDLLIYNLSSQTSAHTASTYIKLSPPYIFYYSYSQSLNMHRRLSSLITSTQHFCKSAPTSLMPN